MFFIFFSNKVLVLLYLIIQFLMKLIFLGQLIFVLLQLLANLRWLNFKFLFLKLQIILMLLLLLS